MALTSLRNFRTQLQVQALAGSTAAGTRGQTQQSFTTVATVYGYVRSLSGRELAAAREVVSTATHSVETHYSSYLTPKARFKSGSVYLNIESVIDVDGRGRYKRCLCTEEVSQ